MNIEKAKSLKKGAIVRYPADRGDLAGQGTVVDETAIIQSATVNKNSLGAEYIWVQVKSSTGKTSVWPSNRLN